MATYPGLPGLKPIYKRQGLGLTALGRATGYSPKTLSNVISGWKPATDLCLGRLCRTLGCTVQELITPRKEDPRA